MNEIKSYVKMNEHTMDYTLYTVYCILYIAHSILYIALTGNANVMTSSNSSNEVATILVEPPLFNPNPYVIIFTSNELVIELYLVSFAKDNFVGGSETDGDFFRVGDAIGDTLGAVTGAQMGA